MVSLPRCILLSAVVWILFSHVRSQGYVSPPPTAPRPRPTHPPTPGYTSCPPGYQQAYGKKCKDINECNVNNGGCNHTCINYDGSYYCTCNPGYRLSNNYHTCMDINECAWDNGGCDQKCINEPGSFSCACYEGFRLDHYRCKDIDECSKDLDNCDQRCFNTKGSFLCYCYPGYELGVNGASCIDKNECWVSNGGCSDICVNSQGNYSCECPPGYTLDSNLRTCIDDDECNPRSPCEQRLANKYIIYNIQYCIYLTFACSFPQVCQHSRQF